MSGWTQPKIHWKEEAGVCFCFILILFSSWDAIRSISGYPPALASVQAWTLHLFFFFLPWPLGWLLALFIIFFKTPFLNSSLLLHILVQTYTCSPLPTLLVPSARIPAEILVLISRSAPRAVSIPPWLRSPLHRAVHHPVRPGRSRQGVSWWVFIKPPLSIYITLVLMLCVFACE